MPSIRLSELLTPSIIATTECRKHFAPHGSHCWYFLKMDDTIGWGICNDRAVRAGHNFPINPESLAFVRNTKHIRKS